MATGSMRWWRDHKIGLIVWSLATAVIIVVPFTNFFIPSESTSAHKLRGWGYYGYTIFLMALYTVLVVQANRTIKTLSGIRRMEVQIFMLGGCVAFIGVVALMGINALTHDSIYIRMQPVMFLLPFGGTIVAITTHRVFDARQITMLVIEKLLLIAVLSSLGVAVYWLLAGLLPGPVDLVATVAVLVWAASLIGRRLDQLFRFYPKAFAAREAMLWSMREQRGIEALKLELVEVLNGWGQSAHSVIIEFARETPMIPGSPASVAAALMPLRWVTPERLAREKKTPERELLGGYLRTHRLGALVVCEGPSVIVLVGVGIPLSYHPFSYPQVTELKELAVLIESAMEQAQFATKTERTAQLATVGLIGASLAHEIRNPLATIKTFFQLLRAGKVEPGHRDHFFDLVGGEITRIDKLTEQLLELATPRVYSMHLIELHQELHASLELVSGKANEMNVRVLTEFHAWPDTVFTDPAAVRQVVINLCVNAIQALEAHEGERWVKVSTRTAAGGVEFAVADSGPGIPDDLRGRLFAPFQTTKATGFGLGLAICSEILGKIRATISLDPVSPGLGATFRVALPSEPPSS